MKYLQPASITILLLAPRFIGLELVRQPEVTSLNPLKKLPFMVLKQLSILAQSFGTQSHFTFVFLALLQYSDLA